MQNLGAEPNPRSRFGHRVDKDEASHKSMVQRVVNSPSLAVFLASKFRERANNEQARAGLARCPVTWHHQHHSEIGQRPREPHMALPLNLFVLNSTSLPSPTFHKADQILNNTLERLLLLDRLIFPHQPVLQHLTRIPVQPLQHLQMLAQLVVFEA